MPRPEQKTIQLTIDGREIEAVEGSMLVDAAKQGDVEIPYFCYEPKLGAPVGACRMCLVEIEGIPKLQTSCSTPVKDGMVVNTQTDRVRHAQNAVVEFLLVNHPLDCPVCDKGGECPLQDITFGWGLGRSRFIEPKRHFQKPLALSPLVAIDRERCILCYRCVRFSQEISEDYQLIFAERGAHTFVSTHDGHPYVAPFSGNITELCPVGALTSTSYRFRARPWDIEGAAGICTMCPSQCNVTLTVRDERVMRVLSRDHTAVDDGWLCDKGRYAFQSFHVDERITQPLVRDGGELRPVSWERALSTAAGLARHQGRVGALVGGQASNEEGYLLGRLMREGLGSPHIDSRGTAIPTALMRSLSEPRLQASVPDLEFAHTVLMVGVEPVDESPILDLRLRKGVRRNGMKLVVASARPSTLDPNATRIIRHAPGGEYELLNELATTLDGGSASAEAAALAEQLREGGEDIVILWGERIGPDAAGALLRIADLLGLGDHPGAGLLGIPAGTNGRGLREVGAVPDAGPGFSPLDGKPGAGAAEIARRTADNEITALYLMQTDPVRDLPDRDLWERALHSAALVVAHASVLTEGLREHASVIFPAQTYAEKEGTVVHPDGRLQRLRIGVALPGEVQPGWAVIAEVARRCELEIDVSTSVEVFEALVSAVPFYAELDVDTIGGRGVRWCERDEAAQFYGGLSAEDRGLTGAPAAAASPEPQNGALRLGRYRPIWAAPEVEISPTLQYLVPHQQLELSPEDARRLGVRHGEAVSVAQNGTKLPARAFVRSSVPAGSAFLAEGLAGEDSANRLTEPLIEVHKA
jgi:NADH-quinone oxidoreductase subunit G